MTKDIIIGGIVAALVFFAYTGIKQRGVQAERVRVETTGKSIDATVQKRQRAIAAQPAPRVLDRWETP